MRLAGYAERLFLKKPSGEGIVWGEEATKPKVNGKGSQSVAHFTTQGGLIKGMSGRLLREMLSRVAFKDGLKSLMKRCSPIYALNNEGRLWRAGLTADPHARSEKCTRGEPASKLDSLLFFAKREGGLT